MHPHEQRLTADQCDNLAQELLQEAACMPSGSRRERLLELAEAYGVLGQMKRMVLRKTN
jgi:hypothetical protein